MRKFEVGVLVILMLLGNKLGSDFGMGVAFCAFLILDDLFERISKRPHKK